jgi:hypothetical protein
MSSNFSAKSDSSFFCSNAKLKPKIASMPVANTLSYIRNTTSSGNLCNVRKWNGQNCQVRRTIVDLPIAEHGEEPL